MSLHVPFKQAELFGTDGHTEIWLPKVTHSGALQSKLERMPQSICLETVTPTGRLSGPMWEGRWTEACQPASRAFGVTARSCYTLTRLWLTYCGISYCVLDQ